MSNKLLYYPYPHLSLLIHFSYHFFFLISDSQDEDEIHQLGIQQHTTPQPKFSNIARVQCYMALGMLHGRCVVWRCQLSDIYDRLEFQQQLLESRPRSRSELAATSALEQESFSITENAVLRFKQQLLTAELELSKLEQVLTEALGDSSSLSVTSTTNISFGDSDIIDKEALERLEYIVETAKHMAQTVQQSMQIRIGDGLDIDLDEPSVGCIDDKIEKIVKPIEDLLQDFRL